MSRSTTDRDSSQGAASQRRPQPRRGASGAWTRLKTATTDPLEAYGLPSKGEVKLHDFKTQEAYYTKIVERYMRFCATAGGGESLEQAFSSLSIDHDSEISRTSLPRQHPAVERTNDMPGILLAMRKLREGIRASRRRDTFAQRAYMCIIHASILTRHWESYQPALLYLLHEVHPHTPLSPPEWQEFSGYRILDLACRQDELREALALKLQMRNRDRKVQATLRALVQDDWVRFWRVRHAVDGYQRAIMEFAVERMRLHTLKCLGRSYMNAGKSFIERSTDAAWEELVDSGVGWQLQESGDVVIRKPKPR